MWVLRTGRHRPGSHTPGAGTIPGQTGLLEGEGITPASCGPGRPGSWHLPAGFSSPSPVPPVPPSSKQKRAQEGRDPQGSDELSLWPTVGGSMTLALAMQTIYNCCLSSEVPQGI